MSSPSPSPSLIRTPRLYLTRLSPSSHLHDFHELWNSPLAVQWSTGSVKTTIEESREWMDVVMPGVGSAGDTDKFAVMLRPDQERLEDDDEVKGGEEEGEEEEKGEGDKMIGLVGTNRWCPQGMETGYCFNIKYWGKGYATEAYAAFLELFWGLDDRKHICKLVAKTHPDNIASQRVLQKCKARKGEVLEKVYERAVDKGEKSDVLLWYFDRPGMGIVEGDGRVGGVDEGV